MQSLSERISLAIRDVPDFPKPGIVFKDIAPLFADPALSRDMVEALADQALAHGAQLICGVESRGFLLGPAIAIRTGLPFVPVRKAGKLPGDVVAKHYSLEYGTATIEIQQGVIPPNSRVFLHDDLIATGGTAKAAVELIRSLGSQVIAAGFIVNLTLLPGDHMLREMGVYTGALVHY